MARLSYHFIILAVANFSTAAAFVVGERCRMTHCTPLFSTLTATETELLTKIRDGVAEAGHGEEWQNSAVLISENTGLEVDESEIILSKALEWRAWVMAPSPTMRKYIRTKVPSSESMAASLEWLSSKPLQLSRDLLKDAVMNYPQAFLLEPAVQFEKALQSAPPGQYDDPESLAALVQSDLSAMKNNYNCATAEEGCAGNCGTCWVTYGKK